MPEQRTFGYDVFLSHNQADKPRVRKLAERLRAAGLRVWFDEWTVKHGDIISLKVDEGLEQSRVLLLCISPNALASNWVALERSTATHRDPANEGRRFIPLLLADCDLPDTLRRYKYVDFRKEAEAAFAEVVAVCRPEAAETPPAAEPAPTKEPTKKTPQPAKPPQHIGPLAVLERELTGHTDWVRSVAVSPDGNWAASGSDDETIKIWDLDTGECRATLKGHAGYVRCARYLGDARRIISGGEENAIRIWDLEKKVTESEWTVGSPIVQALAVSMRTRAIVASRLDDDDPTLEVRAVPSGDLLKQLIGHHRAVWSVAITNDGKRGLSASLDQAIKFWNLETSECLATLNGHTSAVASVQITPDGRFAVSGSHDNTVKVWDLEARTCVGTLEGHQSQVHSVAISPDVTLIASTGFVDKTVRLWDWKSGACLQVIKNVEIGSPISVTFSPDGSRLVVGTASGGVIYVYHLTGVRPRTFG